ncbi:hypothetical protein M231_07287 [Tremella mesenterica]|uniref:DUF3074 domain-containing protein n=1 Tax=Tremella mesenterica TaxID=5217 RepID=A0A4Q1B9N1_TREME|nr:hypothetical protein M231_07287 [Tremella mesenterica]
MTVPSKIKTPLLDLKPLTPEDVPSPDSPEFCAFLDTYFTYGETLAGTMDKWKKHSVKCDGTVQIVNLHNSAGCLEAKKQLGIKEYWCGRISIHTTQSIRQIEHPLPRRSSSQYNPLTLVHAISHSLHLDTPSSTTSPGAPEEPHRRQPPINGDGNESNLHAIVEDEVDEQTRQAKVMNDAPETLYERFRRGLLEYHSENEREYIESCRETECLQVFQPHVAEVWRLTYKTPPPTNPRTFVVLLLSRELKTDPKGQREFMNISIPFDHPNCPPKQGGEKSRVRGAYVSVERVRELDEGTKVEWKMATSSDAGGNVLRFMTNASLPGKIAEDVPSFLKWMVRRFPQGGEVASHPASA